MNPIALIALGRGAEAKTIIMRALRIIAEKKLAVLRKTVGNVVCEAVAEKIEEYAASDHRPGDTVRYRLGAEGHLRVAKIKKMLTGGYMVVDRGGFHYRVPTHTVVHNERTGYTRKELNEVNIMRQGRTVLIRRRIRKGKLQRNIRRSAVKGFTLRRGKITRIPVAKRIHMRIVQRRAARKRKAHLQQTLRKRKLSIRKRKALGIK